MQMYEQTLRTYALNHTFTETNGEFIAMNELTGATLMKY